MIWDVDRIEVLEHVIGAFSVSIRCRVKGRVEEWVFVGVYGPNLRLEVSDFLQELDDIKALWDLPWCIGGDINLIKFSWERRGGGGSGRDAGMAKFEAFIDRWGLFDGPLKRAKNTWSSFQQNVSLSRIDRFLYCGAWEDLFPNRSQSVLARTTSNHSPICLGVCRSFGGPDPFKFEEWWFLELDFFYVVSNEWNCVVY